MSPISKLAGSAVLAFATVVSTGCTDESQEQTIPFKDPARITCYSGGKLIYDGYSTGSIRRSKNTYRFHDHATGRARETGGECVLDFAAPKSAKLSSSVTP